MKDFEDAKIALGNDNAKWCRAWRENLPKLHLDSSATLQEADAALAIWQLLPATQSEFNNRSRRVRRMEEETQAFGDQVRALLASMERAGAGVSDVAEAKLLTTALKGVRDVDSKATLARTQLDAAKRDTSGWIHQAAQ